MASVKPSYHRLAAIALLAALAGRCAPADEAPPDLGRAAGAVTLRDAIGQAAAMYHIPADLLAAIAWSETRFGPPVSPEAHADGVVEGAEGEAAHQVPGVGPLHLGEGETGRQARGLDTLSRAMALTGLSRAQLTEHVGYGVAGAAAVLAALGAETHAREGDLGSWAEAVARFSGLAERPFQASYARQVFAVLRDGVTETAYTGEPVSVTGHPELPDAESLLGVSQAAQHSADYGPALWSAASTSNYTGGRSGASITHIVIHTMQGSYAGSISWFRNPSSSASAHYMIRSSDGEVTQMVRHTDTAWHGGNWYYNTHSIGIEHEGFVADPGRWYTDAMYRSSARLVRALCDRYNIPIDRSHIIGHYQIPRSGSGAPCATTATNCGGAGGHTDPGNGGTQWNWTRFLELVRNNGSTTPPPPPPPAYAATFVQMSCPTSATSGERPVAWIEYRNTGTATWQPASTRVGTTNPRDHNGIFFDQENWVTRNRPSGVDRTTAPNAVGRFSFVLGIPEVSAAMTLSETYAPVQEGVTWFGPGDSVARCSVRVNPRAAPPPPPLDAGVRDAGTPQPVDAGNPQPVDAGNPQPVDAGNPEPVDAGNPEPVDAGNAEPVDAGSEEPVDAAGPDPEPGPTQEPLREGDSGGCGCHVDRGPAPARATHLAALAGLGAVLSARRRRRRDATK